MLADQASVYQAQGDLEKAAKFLSDINADTPSPNAFYVKVLQLRLERNHIGAVRLLQARLAQPFVSEFEKDQDLVALALTQHLAGDTAGTKLTAEQARNTLEQGYRDQPDNVFFSELISRAYAVSGEKDLALKAAERAIMALPSAKDAIAGPGADENLALILTIIGENSRAISTLAQLLRTPYGSGARRTPITPALLRLDPIWDPLRSDPAFPARESSRESARFRSAIDSYGRRIWIADTRRDDGKRFVVRGRMRS
jgi:tetratricopeptide (TPR) repeat protein